MKEDERDELLIQIAEDVAQIVLARSNRDLLAKLESPVVGEIREGLEGK